MISHKFSVARFLHIVWYIYPFEDVDSLLVCSLKKAEILRFSRKMPWNPNYVPDYPKVGEGDYAEGEKVSNGD